MSELIKSEIYNGIKIDVSYDNDRFFMSDFLDNSLTKFDIHPRFFDGHSKEIIEAEKSEEMGISEPIFGYSHSGKTISLAPFSCPWDSGQAGRCFISRKSIRKHFEVKRITKRIMEMAKKLFNCEFEIMKSIIEGNVFLISIYKGEDCLESISLIYGEKCLEEQIEYVKASIDNGYLK